MTDSVPSWCRQGYYIDAKDSMSDWCVAQVTEICETKKTVTVFHDGWGTKTTIYPFKSSKIAPFRKNTLKYTGPKRSAIRDWSITEHELADMQNQIDAVLESNLQNGDAFYVTQFYRGKLYIFIENLLTCSYKSNRSFLKPVVKFFGSVVQLIVAWLKKAPELFPYYYKASTQPDLYLEERNVALALVWPELMDTLNKLFALDNRVADFFQTYDEVPEDYESSPLTLMKDKKYSETLMYIINLFTKENGFEAVIAILAEKDEQKRVPFPFIATTLLYVLVQFIDPEYWKGFSQKMTHAIYQRIDIISELELKDLKHEDILRVLGMIKDSSENLDVKKINFFLRMIRSNYFEKRIKGLSEINTIIENIDLKADYSKTKLSREELKDWVLQNNVIESVVSERPHVELIKRVSTLYKFLAICKSLETSHIETLWNSMQGKHESYIRATYVAILEFVPSLSEDLNDFLYSKIKAVGLEQYDESFLVLVKDFTAAALTQSIRYALQNRRDYNKTFGLEILDSLMLDNCAVDFCRQSCKYIGFIFINPLTRKLQDAYINKLIGLITHNESVPQCLKLLRKLIKGMKDHKRIIAEIKQLNDNHKLVDLVLKNLNVYLEKSREIQDQDIWNKTVVGRFSHEDNLKIRLLFLEFLILYSNGIIRLEEESITSLWKMLGESPIDHERNLLFDWITNGIKRKPQLDEDNTKFIFKEILMDDSKFSVCQVSEPAFSCFKWIFLNYHYNEENIEVAANKFKFRKSAKLEGFEKLILIQLNSENVSDEAAKFIISLLLRFGPQFLGLASKIQEEFTDSLLTLILQSKDNDKLVTRGLNLLKLLLGDSDSQDFTPNAFVYVHEVMNRDFQKVYYDQGRTLRHLRKEIARLYKRPLECTFLQFSEKKFSGVDDEMELTKVKAHCISVEFKHPEYKEHNPLPGLSMNQRVIKTLFELLSNTEKSYTDVAWSLLVSLPTNQQLEEAIYALEQPLEQLLDQTSMHKLLYELMIIQKLSADKSWAQKFIKAKGLKQLIQIFYNAPNAEKAPIRQEAMIKTISEFINPKVVIENVEKFISVFFSSVVGILSSEYEVKDIDGFVKGIENIVTYIEDEFELVLKKYVNDNQEILNQIFNSVLISKPKNKLNAYIEDQLEKMARSIEGYNTFFESLFNMREMALKDSNENYWKLLSFTVKFAENNEKNKAILVSELINFIKSISPEKSSNDKNESLCGALTVLSNSWTSSIEVRKSHVKLFLIRCLFEIPENIDRHSLAPPICKHPETRTCAFNVVLELCKIDSKFMTRVLRELDKFHDEPDWRTSRRAEWAISAVSKEKSQAGLVGIKNLGSTCYMNSLIQQLFMLNSFRNGILALATEASDDNLLYQLQYLFASLQCSDKQYINPKAFAKNIRDFDGNPINLNEQMDVDEFFNYFMDKLEGYLKDTPSQNLIKKHFGGLQVTELIGKDCIHRSERYEPFLSINVEVKNKKSLQEGLESFVQGEMLEGENAYQCDHCEAKVRAVRRVCIKHLPNHMIITLRRFEFDFDSMTRVKLNDFCEFPLEINMEPFTQEGLDRQEKASKDQAIPPKRFSDSYYHYKLRGIVIHAGTAEMGHYYSYINDKAQSGWFEFNDIWVREFNPSEIPEECFGGEEKISWSSAFTNSQATGIREKNGNAYLLFYERDTFFEVRNPDDENVEPTSLDVSITGELTHLKTIRKQNQKYWRTKHVFANEYSTFVSGLSKFEHMPFKFVLKFTLTILLRTKEKKEEFIYMYLRIEKEIKNSPDKAKWVLDLFGAQSVCKEFLLYCPIPNMRYIVVGFIKAALNSVDPVHCETFMLKILHLINFAKKAYTKNFSQYLEVLKLSVLKCKESIEKYEIVKILIRYLVQQEITTPERPQDTESDIFLGYDHFLINDNEKSDLYYSDSKNMSYGHIFELLYKLRKTIPEKWLKLLRQGQTIEELLRSVDNKLSIRYFGKLFAYLMSDTKENIVLYVKKLNEYFQSVDFFSRSRSYRLFTPFLLKKSAFQSEIIDYFLKIKHKMVKTCKYINEVEQFITYIFSLCYKSKSFHLILKQQTELVQWIEKWVKENMHYGFANSKSTQFEESVRPSLKLLLAKHQKIMKTEDLQSENYWDSGDDIEEEKLQKDNKIDTVEGNGQHWAKAVIRERIGDLLYLKVKSWDNSEFCTLVDAYSNDLAPAGYHTSKSGASLVDKV